MPKQQKMAKRGKIKVSRLISESNLSEDLKKNCFSSGNSYETVLLKKLTATKKLNSSLTIDHI